METYSYRNKNVEVRVPAKMAQWWNPFAGETKSDPTSAASALKRAWAVLSDAMSNPAAYKLDNADQERLRTFSDSVGKLNQMVSSGRSYGAAPLAAEVAAGIPNMVQLLKMARQEQVRSLSKLISRVDALGPVVNGLARGKQAPQKSQAPGAEMPVPQPASAPKSPSWMAPKSMTEQDLPPASMSA